MYSRPTHGLPVTHRWAPLSYRDSSSCAIGNINRGRTKFRTTCLRPSKSRTARDRRDRCEPTQAKTGGRRAAKSCRFFAVGVEGADMETLGAAFELRVAAQARRLEIPAVVRLAVVFAQRGVEIASRRRRAAAIAPGVGRGLSNVERQMADRDGIGHRHIAPAQQQLCQDSGGHAEMETAAGPVLLAAVSDGAGSAAYSHIGSRLAVRQAH